MQFETRTAESTILLGERLAQLLKPGAVVALYGELGSGKTTLIKGVARGLGVREPVRSPSFVIITEYAGRVPVYHIDLYRLNNAEEASAVGLESYLSSDGVCLIEWAERAESLLPAATIRIRLEVIAGGRRIEIEGLAPELMQELKQFG
ncbi:MAG: tRNA (adenosine(37)-N6)-threonylcarbamoyltransferase complex ATPase subunit type 1 TsaE [candidate division WOR-3 bacterium]|uniref:tRNA threonylcarbamoyladenosine biosynthesis protein TsaE n=1 Tax=candidate division WOR-3 bacterium TaxID=2052148 RepID=A0A7C1RYV1_UNCW3|nr:tRNA (adenosine(37)-N6)-threonylcarbamoyltransferase complex ATPase subunit type 1 TsaE [candidate division WOR-3 bacterium]